MEHSTPIYRKLVNRDEASMMVIPLGQQIALMIFDVSPPESIRPTDPQLVASGSMLDQSDPGDKVEATDVGGVEVSEEQERNS